MDDTIDLLQIKIENAKRQLPEDTLNAIAAVPWQASILKMRETKGYTFEQLGDLELETELLLCGLVTSKDYPAELEKRMNISKPAANELVLEMNSEVFSKIKEELIKSTERKKMFLKNEERPIEISIVKPNVVPEETEAEKKTNMQVLSTHGIEIITDHPAPFAPAERVSGKADLTIPELNPPAELISKVGNEMPKTSPILAPKLGGTFQIPTIKTEHTLENITPARNASSTANAGGKVESPVVKPAIQPSIVKTYPPKGDPYRLSPED